MSRSGGGLLDSLLHTSPPPWEVREHVLMFLYYPSPSKYHFNRPLWHGHTHPYYAFSSMPSIIVVNGAPIAPGVFRKNKLNNCQKGLISYLKRNNIMSTSLFSNILSIPVTCRTMTYILILFILHYPLTSVVQ